MVALLHTAPSGDRLRAIDGFLAAAYADLTKHDDRLRGIAVEVRFDRGVAHLTGDVADHGELALVRQLIGQLDGILAVWSRVRVAGREPIVLDLGCGAAKQYPGNLGLDLRLAPGVDAKADLSGSLPLVGPCQRGRRSDPRTAAGPTDDQAHLPAPTRRPPVVPAACRVRRRLDLRRPHPSWRRRAGTRGQPPGPLLRLTVRMETADPGDLGRVGGQSTIGLPLSAAPTIVPPVPPSLAPSSRSAAPAPTGHPDPTGTRPDRHSI